MFNEAMRLPTHFIQWAFETNQSKLDHLSPLPEELEERGAADGQSPPTESVTEGVNTAKKEISRSDYQLHSPPKWKEIFPVYEKIKRDWFEKIKSTDNQLTEIRITNELKKCSSCPKEIELKTILNQGMDYKSFKLRYEYCLGSIQTLDKLIVLVFSDFTQKTRLHRFQHNPSFKSRAVLIDIDHSNKTYAEYQEGLNEYYQMSKGIGSLGDRELYLSKTGVAEVGHTMVAYFSQTSNEYDFFDTSFTIIGKYRALLAMKEAYQRWESKVSTAHHYDPSSVCQDNYNLCNQYVLAYLIARQSCNDHALVVNLFQKELRSRPEEFISIIAGLGALNPKSY